MKWKPGKCLTRNVVGNRLLHFGPSVNVTDHYKVLQVGPDASLKDIKSAYYELSKKYHPDLNPSPSAEIKFSQIKEAYDVLSSVKGRHLYDKQRTWRPDEKPTTHRRNRRDDFWMGDDQWYYRDNYRDFDPRPASDGMSMRNKRWKRFEAKFNASWDQFAEEERVRSRVNHQQSQRQRMNTSRNVVMLDFILIILVFWFLMLPFYVTQQAENPKSKQKEDK